MTQKCRLCETILTAEEIKKNGDVCAICDADEKRIDEIESEYYGDN